MAKSIRVKKIDIYILKEFAGPFLLGLSAIIIVYLSAILFEMTDYIIQKGFPMRAVAKMTLLWMPGITADSIPTAVLFAILIGLGRLVKDHELSVIRMAGMSMARLAVPVLFFGLLTSLLCFFINEVVVPESNHQSENILREMLLKEPEINLITNRWFGDEKRQLFVEKYNKDTGQMENITIYFVNENGFPERIDAKIGYTEGDVWVLENGFRHVFDDSGRLEVEQRFEEFKYRINKDVQYFFSNARTTKELSRRELGAIIQSFRNSSLESIKGLHVDYHLKLSMPFAALIFSLLAIGLSNFSPRGIFLYGVIASGSVATAYYTGIGIFRTFGASGKLNPLLAAWAPNLLLLALGIILLYRSERH